MVFPIQRFAQVGFGQSWGICFTFVAAITLPHVAQAQVIPDGTLPTVVGSPNGLDFVIEGGDRSGNNLFHSFSQFSVPTGGSAVFNNAAEISNIFSRVTGGTSSTLDGLLQAGDSANLFLLNPNGIIFGPNATLNLGGSFVGTTASSIQFSDGIEFSTANPTGLLTMAVPVGLQMGQNPGAIQNDANLPSALPLTDFIPGGLQVQQGKSLVLLGGDVVFDGGAASALNGQVEVGGVGTNSFVGLISHDFGFELNYDRVQTFQDVRLQNLATLDARDGGVQVQGRQISLLNGAHILSDLIQATSSRGITLKATESIDLSGTAPVMPPEGRLEVPIYLSSVTAQDPSGIGGNISLTAPTIKMANQATIVAVSEEGQGGNIRIQANQLNVIDSYIISAVYGSGQGGDLLLPVNQLNVMNAGQIGSITYTGGNSGNLTIQAKEVKVSGMKKVDEFGFSIGSVLFTTTQGSGKGGTLMLQTERLRVADGGLVATTTFDQGDAGNLIIQASDFVELASANRESIYPTGLVADATQLPELLSQNLIGNSGNIQVTTGRLLIKEGGAIVMGNPGQGDSGSLTINASSVTLNGGTLNAAIASGKKGNITINTDILQMRNGSKIITNASNQANSGDISINAPLILGLEDSDIMANAVEGQGGNIQITTQGLLGLKYRSRLTSENDITASSKFGLNGAVEVQVVGVDPSSGLATLSIEPVDSSQQITASCTQSSDASFMVTGRGGLPQNPTQQLVAYESWRDTRELSDRKSPDLEKVHSITAKPSAALIEATAWQLNGQGQPQLIAGGAAGVQSSGDWQNPSQALSCANSAQQP
jgi:filamentous hemagglutinin family protein